MCNIYYYVLLLRCLPNNTRFGAVIPSSVVFSTPLEISTCVTLCLICIDHQLSKEDN